MPGPAGGIPGIPTVGNPFGLPGHSNNRSGGGLPGIPRMGNPFGIPGHDSSSGGGMPPPSGGGGGPSFPMGGGSWSDLFKGTQAGGPQMFQPGGTPLGTHLPFTGTMTNAPNTTQQMPVMPQVKGPMTGTMTNSPGMPIGGTFPTGAGNGGPAGQVTNPNAPQPPLVPNANTPSTNNYGGSPSPFNLPTQANVASQPAPWLSKVMPTQQSSFGALGR